MPYSLSNPPKKLRRLPAKKQRQFIHVFNQALESGDDEETAHKKAWGVVRKSADEGIMIGPAESEGSIWDATLNADILQSKADVFVARDIVALVKELGKRYEKS